MAYLELVSFDKKYGDIFMAKFFGFIPSEILQNKISTLRSERASGANNIYVARDDMLLQLIDEQIDQVLTELITLLPEGSKKKTMEKTTGIVKSAAKTLLKQLLGKSSNEEAQASLDFIENIGLNTDSEGKERVSFKIPDSMFDRMQTLFAQVESGDGEPIRKEIELFFKDFTDENLKHYIKEFSSTLKLGFIKRKAIPIAESAISKGVKMGNKDLFPHLGQDELEKLVGHYKPLFFEI